MRCVFGAGGVPVGGGTVMTESDLEWKIVHTPDLDGDGRADILWWNAQTGKVWAMLMNGTAIAAQGLVHTEPDTAWRIVALGDFAGSGKANQLLWSHEGTGLVYLMTVSHAGGGVFAQTGQQIYQQPDGAWRILGALDFNGDGRADIVWRNEATGQVYVMLMNAAAIVSEAVVHTAPDLAWKVVALGDYDGDGKADLLWRHETTGLVYLMLMNGLSVRAEAAVYQEPEPAWRILGLLEWGRALGLFAP